MFALRDRTRSDQVRPNCGANSPSVFRIGAIACVLIVAILCTACAPGSDRAKLDASSPTPSDRTLAASARQAWAASRQTPAREIGNRLANENQGLWLAQLEGSRPATAPQLAEARAGITDWVDLLHAGLHWPPPPRFDIPRTAGPLRIDGVIDEQDWNGAAVFRGQYRFDEQRRDGNSTITWRLLWNEDYLYVAFECDDPDLQAPPVERDKEVFFHDCVEVFVLPRLDTGVYWEFVMGPQGSLYDGIRFKKWDEWGFVGRESADLAGLRWAVKVHGTLNDSSDRDQGYVVEVAIPFKELPELSRITPAAGMELRLMLARMDKSKDGFTPYAFIPLLGWGHNIWNHATARLSERRASMEN